MSAEQSPGDKSLRQLEQGLRAGFVNKDYPASPLYLPQFLVNDSQKDKKVQHVKFEVNKQKQEKIN